MPLAEECIKSSLPLQAAKLWVFSGLLIIAYETGSPLHKEKLQELSIGISMKAEINPDAMTKQAIREAFKILHKLVEDFNT